MIQTGLVKNIAPRLRELVLVASGCRMTQRNQTLTFLTIPVKHNPSPTHLYDHAGHVLPEEVPAVAVPLRDESELGDDEVDVHLGGHVHQAAPQAVLREDQEDVLQDGAHVLRG